MEKYAFLERTLGLFNNEEPWMGPHKEVMATYERADIVDQQCVMLVAVFQCLEDICKRHNEPSRTITSSDARKLCDL